MIVVWVMVGVLYAAVFWQFKAIVLPIWHEAWARKHGWVKSDA